MSNSLALGHPAPAFSLPNQNGEMVSLASLKGKWVVLYFYPKDNTSGCTTEALDFTHRLADFEAKGAVVIGVSPDSIQSHGKFIEKHDLKVTLLSDPEKTVLAEYGVWQEKKMYGRTYMGVVRSTFLIDPAGILREAWTKVKVKGHVDAVWQKLNELTAA
ncbi:MAG: thioredoxin-dependent thiol peroxidase [Gemmatimonadetes bacterium]|nr:MAG: thioredoxin-dependent thiol peroxidase [Gemmatimonadota bacterium]